MTRTQERLLRESADRVWFGRHFDRTLEGQHCTTPHRPVHKHSRWAMRQMSKSGQSWTGRSESIPMSALSELVKTPDYSERPVESE